jgi:hypothetical protein
MVWSAFQALVMLVQNRYQKRRMYTRIAMGKNSAMDVVSGESSGSAGQLMVLYPLLFSKCLAASLRLCLEFAYAASLIVPHAAQCNRESVLLFLSLQTSKQNKLQAWFIRLQ